MFGGYQHFGCGNFGGRNPNELHALFEGTGSYLGHNDHVGASKWGQIFLGNDVPGFGHCTQLALLFGAGQRSVTDNFDDFFFVGNARKFYPLEQAFPILGSLVLNVEVAVVNIVIDVLQSFAGPQRVHYKLATRTGPFIG